MSERIRIKLNIKNLEDSHYDFICGDHFSDSCFDENGRLRRDAIPTMFPYRECLTHDHTYDKLEDPGNTWYIRLKNKRLIFILPIQVEQIGLVIISVNI